MAQDGGVRYDAVHCRARFLLPAHVWSRRAPVGTSQRALRKEQQDVVWAAGSRDRKARGASLVP
jgi:hypothetical protein